MIAEFGMLKDILFCIALVWIAVELWIKNHQIKDNKKEISRLSYENTCRAADIRRLAKYGATETSLRSAGQRDQEERCKAKFERLNGIVEKVNSLQGLMTKTIISSKVAAKQAQTAFDLGNDAVLRVGALEKSTHKIQLMPLDQMLARNKAMETKANKVFNPENEINDYLDNGILDGLLGDEELDV